MIAARRTACNTLIFPRQNQKDFEQLPDYLRKGLTAHFAQTYDDVFKIAFKADP